MATQLTRKYTAAAVAFIAATVIAAADSAHALDRGMPGYQIVRASNGLLDGRATEAPLREVLDELGRVTGVEIINFIGAADSHVSFEFTHATVRDAVDRILRGHSYMTAGCGARRDCDQIGKITVLNGRGANAAAAPSAIPTAYRGSSTDRREVDSAAGRASGLDVGGRASDAGDANVAIPVKHVATPRQAVADDLTYAGYDPTAPIGQQQLYMYDISSGTPGGS
jgi:hypothetical protein